MCDFASVTDDTELLGYEQSNHVYGSIPRVIEFEEGSSEEPCDDDCEDDGFYPTIIKQEESFWGSVIALKSCAFSSSTIRSLVLAILLFAFFSSHHAAPSHLLDKNMELLGSRKGSKEETLLEEWQVPHYYEDQLVDHFSPHEMTLTWPNRYYVSSQHWKGPGSPLIVIMGGEGPVDSVFYPFVREDLAKQFGAYVLQTEHRFYGTGFPYRNGETPTSDELKQYLSPDQALEDYVRIIRYFQQETLGCSLDRTSVEYCPVITVGASYPGFLSAMMRFLYPNVVDMAYASSAPIRLYSREITDQYLYFDLITRVAETASPGCTKVYKSTLQKIYDKVSTIPVEKAAKKLGICGGTRFPKYITSPEILAQELTMMVGFSFADFDMDYHPPGDPNTNLIQACAAVQQRHKSPLERYADYLLIKAADEEHADPECYDLNWGIPAGPNSTITGSDWTGMGDGSVGNAWEFQCCRDLIVNAGYSPSSMFWDRPFELDWLRDHCQSRFQVDPQPTRMVDKWHFDDLVKGGGSYILFTNGLNDGWSVFSHTHSLSDTMPALNFPSGAHHSELNTVRKGQKENVDIIVGRKKIGDILGRWIAVVKAKQLQ